MTQRVAVFLDSRDHFSRGHARRIFGYEAYHWGILVMPPASKGRGCQTFEATDACEIDPVTFRLNNPTMDWWYRAKRNVDLELSTKLLGLVVIGEIPDGISEAELHDFFERVPLPAKNTHPQQSCVTWTVDAIRSLQSQGWSREFEIDGCKDSALTYADERMRGSESQEPKVHVMHYEASGVSGRAETLASSLRPNV